MLYGVIVCSRCKTLKGADLSKKTTRCHRCGKHLEISNQQIMYKSKYIDEIQQAIGLLNAEREGKLDEFKKLTLKK